jgi:hypothetical protein
MLTHTAFVEWGSLMELLLFMSNVTNVQTVLCCIITIVFRHTPPFLFILHRTACCPGHIRAVFCQSGTVTLSSKVAYQLNEENNTEQRQSASQGRQGVTGMESESEEHDERQHKLHYLDTVIFFSSTERLWRIHADSAATLLEILISPIHAES